MNRADAQNTRSAGEVARYHTWQVNRGQSVGEHSWQAMRLFYELFPEDVTKEVLVYILWHDAPERVTGDPPFPLKRDYPELKEIYSDIEGEVLESWGVSLPPLTEKERFLIKLCDLIEMNQYGRDELMRGNRFAEPIAEDTGQMALRMVAGDPDLTFLVRRECWIPSIHTYRRDEE